MQRVGQLLELMGLADFQNAYPRELSGGMKQRVAIARALANEPAVLLMDEPFGALDAQTREEMQELLLLVRLHWQTTILFVTHDVDEAIFLSDRVIVMTPRPGRVRADIPHRAPHRPHARAEARARVPGLQARDHGDVAREPRATLDVRRALLRPHVRVKAAAGVGRHE